jgi:hypothetical protein
VGLTLGNLFCFVVPWVGGPLNTPRFSGLCAVSSGYGNGGMRSANLFSVCFLRPSWCLPGIVSGGGQTSPGRGNRTQMTGELCLGGRRARATKLKTQMLKCALVLLVLLVRFATTKMALDPISEGNDP